MQRSLSGMLLYGILEALSLVLVYWLVKRRLQANILYNLAFVLETHFFAIQGKMLMFLLYILNFSLQHYGKVAPNEPSSRLSCSHPSSLLFFCATGMDFTFQFAWLRKA